MTAQTKAGTLAEALVAVQAEAPHIALDSQNPHFRNRYPSLAGVMDKVLPVTSRHGLAIVHMPTVLDGEPALTTRIVHTSGEQVESTMLLLPAKRDPQGQGSALTYARRYMVLAMLGLVGDDDDDGNQASRPAAPQAVQQAPRDAAKPRNSNGDGVSETQLVQLRTLVAAAAKAHGKTATEIVQAVEKDRGKPISELTAAEADDLAEKLAKWAGNAKAAA